MGKVSMNRTVSVEALVARVAESLERNVLPHVENHYARLQLRAVREMLLNLGTRVEWRQKDAEAEARLMRDTIEALSEVSQVASAEREITGGETADLAVLREGVARIIREIYAERDAAVRARMLGTLWHAIRAEFDAEAARMRTGMYS